MTDMLLTLLASNCLRQYPKKHGNCWQLIQKKKRACKQFPTRHPHKVEFYKMQTSTQQSIQQ